MLASGDSSSSEEDLSLFQSVAVSAEDVAAAARKEAESLARRRHSKLHTPPAAPGSRTADGSSKAHHHHQQQQQQQQQGPAPNPGEEELDLTSLKIAAALDALLARQLDVEAQQEQQQQPQQAKGRQNVTAAASASGQPFVTDAVAAIETLDMCPGVVSAEDMLDLSTGVRLFKKVPKGTPCRISQQQKQQQQQGISPAEWQRHQQPRRHSIREVIPRFRLAAAAAAAALQDAAANSGSRKGKQKKRRQQCHPGAALTVNGAALLKAALAVPGSNWQSQHCTPGSSSSSLQRPAAAEGVVCNGRPFVAHNVRMAVLLGQQQPPAADSWTH